MWLQFRRRLDRVQPYGRIASYTEAEVRDILLALERIYHPSFPEINLIPTCVLRDNSSIRYDARLPMWDLYQ